ncbi:MAG: ATP-grasp domain-containing protein [Desulfobulbaceae bacterium]|nr:ATP-grasp domain-containing protein [Desulfobulbaceae bacterium]
MNLVYLCPQFPPNYFHFCSRLKKLGVNVLGIGEEPAEALTPQVRDSLTDYRMVDNLHNYDSLIRACGYFTHQYGKIDRVESHNEYWLATDAALRRDFNVQGLKPADMDYIRRKSGMKEVFRKAGIKVAPGQVVHSLAEAEKLIKKTGYPVVAKPDDGVGALDTFKITSYPELILFHNNKPKHDYIMEGFVKGTIFSFDGLTDRDGNIVFCTAHTFSQGIMEVVNNADHLYYHSLKNIPKELENAGRKAVAAFKVRERFFHIEFFKTGPSDYMALEVNMRPPGGYTTDMFNYACDIDVYALWAEVVNGRTTPLEFERKYHCCYASRKNRFNYSHGHQEIMDRYGSYILAVQSVPGVFSSALGDVGYIFRSANESDILEITSFIHQH